MGSCCFKTVASNMGYNQYPQFQQNAGPRQDYPSKPSLPNAVWSICQNYQSLVLLINILTLIIGVIDIAIIGYNFSYYKGSYRTSLFHSELTFLVAFSIAFVLTCISVIVSYMNR